MGYIRVDDSIEIYYKDWGSGQPIVFCHGWPLTADSWDSQMAYFSAQGFRCIAHDRRGHGRSSHTFVGNDMNTYADDLDCLCKTLDLKNIIFVGASTGGGEIVRYIGRHGTDRVAKVVLISAWPRLSKQIKELSSDVPIETFDQIRNELIGDRSKFFKTLSVTFYGGNRGEESLSKELQDSFWLEGMLAGSKGIFDSIKAFKEADFTDDLKKVDVPVLILHGEDDQIIPMKNSHLKLTELLKLSKLKMYKGAPHGMFSTHKEQVNKDLLEFVKG